MTRKDGFKLVQMLSAFALVASLIALAVADDRNSTITVDISGPLVFSTIEVKTTQTQVIPIDTVQLQTSESNEVIPIVNVTEETTPVALGTIRAAVATLEAANATLEAANAAGVPSANATLEADFTALGADLATLEAASRLRLIAHSSQSYVVTRMPPVEGVPPSQEPIATDIQQTPSSSQELSASIATDIQKTPFPNQGSSASTTPAIQQASSPNWTLINLWLVTLISGATFVTTTLYRTWDERRTRMTHELTVAKTQLEIEKLRQEVEEVQQKDKRR